MLYGPGVQLRNTVPLPFGRQWVLVADDDGIVREFWTEALKRAGFRVRAASDGLKALDLMRSIIPDLVILDLRMPALAGEEVLQRIGTTPILSRIPVLIVSGYLDDHPAAGSGLGLNIVGRMAKPVDLDELLRAVRAALEPVVRRPEWD